MWNDKTEQRYLFRLSRILFHLSWFFLDETIATRVRQFDILYCPNPCSAINKFCADGPCFQAGKTRKPSGWMAFVARCGFLQIT